MFDTALIESAAHPGDDRRARSLPLAIGFHGAVLAAVVLSALWSTGELPDPMLIHRVVSFPGGGALLPPPPRGGPVPTLKAAAAHTRSDRLPERIPELPADAPEDQTLETAGSSGETSGESGPGDESGLGGEGPGIPGGIGDESAAPGGGGAPIGRAGVDGVTVPKLVEKVDPVYPEAARRARIQGVVILEAVITASGEVDEVRIVSSASAIFDAAVLAAVRQWRYRPATLDGRAVPVLLTVTVRFGLDG